MGLSCSASPKVEREDSHRTLMTAHPATYRMPAERPVPAHPLEASKMKLGNPALGALAFLVLSVAAVVFTIPRYIRSEDHRPEQATCEVTELEMHKADEAGKIECKYVGVTSATENALWRVSTLSKAGQCSLFGTGCIYTGPRSCRAECWVSQKQGGIEVDFRGSRWSMLPARDLYFLGLFLECALLLSSLFALCMFLNNPNACGTNRMTL
eukprot:TRINITY_DN94615_c0_g1_i1.p1 TRINITY_DN94615_c0_g1~~TRINITY_DN94615_c0_g1_i1.p1  ORF type:complete len:211 (+),score=32.49 TRINITY_DN94615_c0_g1_i1:33-665(+)